MISAKMKDEIHTYLVGCSGRDPEEITGIQYQDGKPWQLFMYEQDVEMWKSTYRVVLVQKCTYDIDDIEAVDYCEDILFECWEI